jgi:hypothetical protein
VCKTGATDLASGLINTGTINFNTSAAIKCDLPLYNADRGALNVLQGTLELTNAGKGTGFSFSQSGGSVNISAGATLKADANTNINGGFFWTVGVGTAYLTGNLTMQAGSVQIGTGPDGGLGTLAVSGQVSFIGTSTLQMVVDPRAGTADHITATGTITLGGSATLMVTTAADGVPTGSYWILLSTTGITGDFAAKEFYGATYNTYIGSDPSGAAWCYWLSVPGGGGGGGGGQGGNPGGPPGP